MSDRTDGTVPPPDQEPTPRAPQGPGDTWATRAGPDTPSASAPDRLPPPVHVPGYEILEELGRGGMGVVYMARQKGLNRLVALKMILSGAHASGEEIERFRSEAEALARLQHPHIIQVYEINECEGRPFFSMEYVPGGSLAALLREHPLPPAEAALLAEDLARAVHAAHEKGIIHRDLKPANVLLVDRASWIAERGKSGERSTLRDSRSTIMPKITDFGLAKQLLDDRGKTRSGDILGTPGYMAPEQAAGKPGKIGPATDIHALGAILYEMLTGRPPFGGETILETLSQVLTAVPVAPRTLTPAVPRDLEVICLKCLRKDPQDRYASARDLADDLARFLAGEPILARPQTPLERFGKWMKRRPARAALAFAPVFLVPLYLVASNLFSAPPPAPVNPPSAPVPRAYADDEIRRSAATVRRGLFERIYHARTPEGWIRNDLGRPDNPESEPWAHIQAICALLRCPEGSREELRELIPAIDLVRARPRLTRGERQYGWTGRPDMVYAQAEPILWAAAALSAALSRPGLLADDERRRCEEFLAETHVILRTYAPTDPAGGWHIVADPRNPAVQNTYVNILALMVLLDTRQAGLPWDGSAEKRDALIAQTARWLVKHFDAGAAPPGWYKENGTRDVILEGLTLQAYSVLLRAADEVDFPLPREILRHCGRHLVECGSRRIDAPDQSAYVSYHFTRHDNKPWHLGQNLKFLWYPWAVRSAVTWPRLAEREGLPASERAAVRSALGHLVVDLGPSAVTSGEAFVYIPSERLYALDAIPAP